MPKTALLLAIVIAMAAGHAALAPSSARAACDPEQSLFVWDPNHTSAATGAWNDADTVNRVLDTCSGAMAVTTSQLGSPVPGDLRQVEVGWQEYHGSGGHAWRMFFELQNGGMEAGNTLGALSCCIAYGWRVVYTSGDGDFHFLYDPGDNNVWTLKAQWTASFVNFNPSNKWAPKGETTRDGNGTGGTDTHYDLHYFTGVGGSWASWTDNHTQQNTLAGYIHCFVSATKYNVINASSC